MLSCRNRRWSGVSNRLIYRIGTSAFRSLDDVFPLDKHYNGMFAPCGSLETSFDPKNKWEAKIRVEQQLTANVKAVAI